MKYFSIGVQYTDGADFNSFIWRGKYVEVRYMLLTAQRDFCLIVDARELPNVLVHLVDFCSAIVDSSTIYKKAQQQRAGHEE